MNIDYNNITPEMRQKAQEELDRRSASGTSDQERQYSDEEKKAAQAELDRRILQGNLENQENPETDESAPQMNIFNRAGSDVLAGVGESAQHLLNFLNKNVSNKIPRSDTDLSALLGVKDPNGVDKFIQSIGSFLPYMAGGEYLAPALGALRIGRAGISFIKPTVNALEKLGKGGFGLGEAGSNVMAQGLSSGAYGAVEDQESPSSGFEEGGTLGALLAAAPYGISKIAKQAPPLIEKFLPQKYADSVISDVSKGKTLQKNNASLADDIVKNYKDQVDQSKKLYQPIFDELGDKPIYEAKYNSALVPSKSKYEAGTYPNQRKNIFFRNEDLNKLHNKFVENPTLDNAHNLQQQLGYEIGKFGDFNLSSMDKSQVSFYKKTRDSLKNDMSSFIKSEDPNLYTQFNDANKHWKENVLPYREKSPISDLVSGEDINLRTLPNVFKNVEGKPNISKIANHLSDESKDKILYSQIHRAKSADALADKMDAFKKEGFEEYLTPEREAQQKVLSDKIRYRNLAQQLGAFSGAAFLGKHLGISGLGDAIVGLAGASQGPQIFKALGANISTDQLANALEKARKAYRPVTQSLLANVENGGQ